MTERNLRNTAISMPYDMHDRFKMAATAQGMNFSAFVRYLFLNWERKQKVTVPADFEEGDTENYPVE